MSFRRERAGNASPFRLVAQRAVGETGAEVSIMIAPPTVDLDKVSYKHRMDASGLLVSKGNSLLDASAIRDGAQKKDRTYVKGEQRGEVVDVGLVLAAIAYYDMALLLKRPFDPNYRTVANWKCNALCAIGQYADAVAWYGEIVRLDAEQNGGAVSKNATTALAREQIVKYRGRTNAPLRYSADDVSDFIAPPFTLYAQTCLNRMARGKYADATLYFEQKDRKKYSAKLLKQKWSELVGGADFADLAINLEEHLFDWKGKSRKDEGWCYFSVSGPDFNEGISFVVGGTGSTGDGSFAVRRIEFGRP